VPRGDKSAYSYKQKRQTEHIEEGYEKEFKERIFKEMSRKLI